MIQPREILRATFTRFLPGAIVAAGGFLAAMSGKALAALSARGWVYIAALVAGLVVGNAVTLLALRTRLRDDAGVGGLRGAIVGALAGALALGLAVTFPLLGIPWRIVQTVQHIVPPGIGFVAGVVGTTMMFLPWIGRGSGATAARDADIAKGR